jgi:ADP-heptose:LPS heptosyltransferase
MHIASSFGKKIVSIWGNTSPSFGMYVYNPIQTNQVSIHQVMDLSCRPCSKIGFKECPKTHFNCMNLQKVETIIKDIN